MLPLLERPVTADPLMARCFSRPPPRILLPLPQRGVDAVSCCGEAGSAMEEEAEEEAVDEVMEEAVSFKDSDLNKAVGGGPVMAFWPVLRELKCLAGGTFAKAL